MTCTGCHHCQVPIRDKDFVASLLSLFGRLTRQTFVDNLLLRCQVPFLVDKDFLTWHSNVSMTQIKNKDRQGSRVNLSQLTKRVQQLNCPLGRRLKRGTQSQEDNHRRIPAWKLLDFYPKNSLQHFSSPSLEPPDTIWRVPWFREPTAMWTWHLLPVELVQKHYQKRKMRVFWQKA